MVHATAPMSGFRLIATGANRFFSTLFWRQMPTHANLSQNCFFMQSIL